MTRVAPWSRRLAWLALLGVAGAVLLLVWRPWGASGGDLEGTAPPSARVDTTEGAPELVGVTRGRAPKASDPAAGEAWKGVLPGPLRLPEAPQPRRTISGRILGPDGEPAAGAGVSAFVPEGAGASSGQGAFASWGQGRRAQEDGRFALEVGFGSRITLDVGMEGALPLRRDYPVANEDSADLGDVRLEEGASLAGTVTLAGRPSSFGLASVRVGWKVAAGTSPMALNGTGVWFAATAEGMFIGKVVTCDAEGRWCLRGVSPGSYEVRVWAINDTPLHGVVAPSVSTNAPATGVDFDVDATLLRVVPPAGIAWLATQRWWIEVMGPDGRRVRVDQPATAERQMLHLADAQVRAALVPSLTDLDVRVQFEGYQAWSTRVRTPAAGEVLTVTAEPVAAVMGVVRLVRPQGEPQATADLTYQVFEPGTDALVRQGTAMLAHSSHPEIRLPVGTHELVLMGPPSEWGLAQRTAVEVSSSEPTTVAWDPPKGARVRAAVEQGPKGPVRCTFVRAGRSDLPLLFTSGVPQQGTFEFPRALESRNDLDYVSPVVEPGVGSIRFEAEGFETQEVPVSLVAGQFTDVKVKLKPLAQR